MVTDHISERKEFFTSNDDKNLVRTIESVYDLLFYHTVSVKSYLWKLRVDSS